MAADGTKPDIRNAGVRDVTFGTGVTVISPANIYECTLGDNVFVGPFVEIQRGVVVGEDTRIQSHSFLCELVTIGARCFIGHGVMFINDKFRNGGPAKGDRSLWQACRVGNNVSIGSNATILPVRIADGTVIGAGAVVTKDIDSAGVYVGNPARKLRSEIEDLEN